MNCQQDIKLGQFTEEELNVLLKKIRSRKIEDLDEIPPEVWKTRKLDDLVLRFCNAIYKQNIMEKWTKGCILPLFMKSDLRITNDYRDIVLTSLAAKFYYVLFLNHIKPEIEKILRKNQNGFQEIDPGFHRF